MRKYLILLLTALIILFPLSGVVQATPKVFIDGNEIVFDVPPDIQNGRILVPLRAIFETLGAEVQWEGATQTVVARKSDTVIKITVGGQAEKNGIPVPIDVSATIKDGRTLVPLRFVSEALGCQVAWDGSTSIVNISRSDNPTQPNKDVLEQQKIYPNDDVFIGPVVNGSKEGQGTYFWKDGDTYDGQWINNQMSGQGNLNILNHQYSGSFSNNKKNGYGTYTWPNGESYTGYWKNDIMDGYGVYLFSNGDKYEGLWSNNQMNGYGIYTFSNGQMLTGIWENNLLK